MKRYILAASKKFKVGDYVNIIGDNFHAGDWGRIIEINPEDDEYFVAMFDDDNDAPVFSRNELKLMKYKPI